MKAGAVPREIIGDSARGPEKVAGFATQNEENVRTIRTPERPNARTIRTIRTIRTKRAGCLVQHPAKWRID
jgi:hypothetical protein